MLSKLQRGSHATMRDLIGLQGQLTQDYDDNILSMHDGATPGGVAINQHHRLSGPASVPMDTTIHYGLYGVVSPEDTVSVSATHGSVAYTDGQVVYQSPGTIETDEIVLDVNGVVSRFEVTSDFTSIMGVFNEVNGGPSARSETSFVVVDNNIYMAGGVGESGILNDFWRYDIAADLWTQLENMPVARRGVSVNVRAKIVYVTGGFEDNVDLTSSEIYIYDILYTGWESYDSAPVVAAGIATATHNGDVYYFGGDQGPGDGGTDVVWSYDSDNGTTTLTVMPTTMRYLTAATIGDTIYVCGGNNEVEALFYAYDPVGDSWSTLTSAPTALRFHSSFVADGKFYVVGGRDQDDYNNTIYCYDPVTAEWTQISTDGPALASSAVVGYEGTGFMFGGTDGETFSDVAWKIS